MGNNLGRGQVGANVKGKIDVFVNDQTEPLFQYFLIHEQKTDILLTSPISLDDTVINVSPGHGFTGIATTPGEIINIYENSKLTQMFVKSVDVNAITVTHPMAQTFTTSAKVIRGNNLLNVDASSSPVDFKMELYNFQTAIDINTIRATMFHTVAGDDGKFGGIAELSNGIYFRKNNGLKFNLGNYINNQAFKNIGGTVEYASKGPAGSESTTVTLDILKIFGKVIRMDNRLSDTFHCRVRDKLDGLDQFIISLIGSYTDEP